MRIVLDGKINRTYVQTLCMIFFKGEKFSENEENPMGELYVKTVDTDNGILCDCVLRYDEKIAKGNSFVEFSANEAYERTSKTAVGKAIYSAGVNLTGKIAPWGIITGIRPSKVVNEVLSKVTDIEEAVAYLQDRYLISESKARLAIAVAKNEEEILNRFSIDTCSLYISIPFCPTRCTYCSFISYATAKLFEQIPSYIEKLTQEIIEKFRIIDKLGLKLVSIYIGGGTPTTLSSIQLDKILATIERCLNGRRLLEFTVEAGRPDTITEEKLSVLKKYNVDRVSVNPQTLNDSVLERIGRKHTVLDFFNSYKLVQKSGIKLVNTDLIAGLDGDTFESFKNTIDEIIKLSPDNVTVHSFSVKKSAQILKDDQNIYNKSDDCATESVDYAYKALIDNGYEPYYMYRQKNTISDLENVGYGKKGTFGIYNVLMMGDGHTVFGAGAGATTKLLKKVDDKIELKRIFAPKYPYEYLQDNQNTEKIIMDFFGK